MSIFSNIVLCVIAGMLAGATRSTLGWLDSGEPFLPRMFSITLLKTIIMGAMTGYGQLNPFVAFFTVYTADSILNKGYKAVTGNSTARRTRQ